MESNQEGVTLADCVPVIASLIERLVPSLTAVSGEQSPVKKQVEIFSRAKAKAGVSTVTVVQRPHRTVTQLSGLVSCKSVQFGFREGMHIFHSNSASSEENWIPVTVRNPCDKACGGSQMCGVQAA